MSAADVERLQSIRTFPQLVAYLRDELEWPIDSDDFDDLTFEYEPEELGLDANSAAKVQEIKQLRPLVTGQPWGVFFVKFEPRKLPVVALRRILGSLITKKRASANASQRPTWAKHDLMFISSHGEGEQREITFAHFTEDQNGNLPTLRVLGWDNADTAIKIDYVAHELETKLRWPDDETDFDCWRAQWSSAFKLRIRETIQTSKELAVRLAELARNIRGKVNAALRIESANGPLRSLMKAVKEALIHDLKDDDFADMYAQTVAYGLLSARVSRHVPGEEPVLYHEDAAALVLPTNPFLKELMETFFRVGGRRFSSEKGRFVGIDFDELGVNDVIDLLKAANMEAVLRDFDNRNPQEDPVVHFYELFLKEYDAKKRMQRGVFYTPKPVVSYIVRSVHELLQTEFGLEHGLADTTTWGEMIERHSSKGPAVSAAGSEFKFPEIEVVDPKTRKVTKKSIDPNTPFVQILDPATGTGTFLVEVIDLIHNHLEAKWKKGGASAMPVLPLPVGGGGEGRGERENARRPSTLASSKTFKTFKDYWNAYVPAALLPRLHGYELMMAPYAIAHMKLGLKLGETGYNFRSNQRARVYLTNALEPPQDFSDTFEQMAPALAHEAKAVNDVKRYQRFTVVVGNPPYSKISSNLTPTARAIVDAYRSVDGLPIREKGALQFEINIQDDYVKFIRRAQEWLDAAGRGILGFITNHGYLTTPTLRGLRWSLLQSFLCMAIIDLHGHAAHDLEGVEDSDENVFDIQQGVAINIARSPLAGGAASNVMHTDLLGSREFKSEYLAKNSIATSETLRVFPSGPLYLMVPRDLGLAEEYASAFALNEVFPKNSAGIITARDGLVIDTDAEALLDRIKAFRVDDRHPDAIYDSFDFSKSKRFDLREAQSRLREEPQLKKFIRPLLYRPFDRRFIFYHDSVVWSMSRPVAAQMYPRHNLALIATRQVTRSQHEHVFVTRDMIEIKACSHDRNTQIMPLFTYPEVEGLRHDRAPSANLNSRFVELLCQSLNRKWLSDLTAEDVFHFAYGQLHSSSYRTRYFAFLKSEFPRIFLPGSGGLFELLAKHGADLVALHLVDEAYPSASWNLHKSHCGGPLSQFVTTYKGPPRPEVEKLTYLPRDRTVWLDKKRTCGFAGVPEEVWNFHIGGYQVCRKWLKDRKGRTLSADDIAHYQKIIVAISETIRIMKEIDEVIEKHGGWPGAFVTEKRP